MSTTTVTKTVMAIGELNITGNVIPASWWRHILLPSGRPDSTAIVLLSEIVYWYRPGEVRDEHTGALSGYRKRFHGDQLQRSYQAFADQFGFSKREATDALKRLKKAGLITLELRTIQTSEGMTLSNVLFLEPVPDAIADINNPVRKSDNKNVTPVPFERNTHSVSTETLPRFNVDDPTLKRETYTEITTETTTEIKNPCPVRAEPDENSSDPAERVLAHFNRVTKSSYRDSKTTMGYIRGRLAEPVYSADDLILVTDYATAKWLNDAKMCDYLRPKTLFGPENFPEYHQKALKWNEAGRPECINGVWLMAGSNFRQPSRAESAIPDGFRGSL